MHRNALLSHVFADMLYWVFMEPIYLALPVSEISVLG